MIEFASLLLLCVTFAAFATKRMMTYMHVLQQEDYDNARLKKWMIEHRAFDKRLSFGLLVITVAWFFLPSLVLIFLLLGTIGLAAYHETDTRKSSKKKLVSTMRAKRIFMPALIITVVMSGWVFIVPSVYASFPLPWVIITQLIPFILITTNLFLRPIENNIQQKYWNEAQYKITALNPTVIGITGSFGKTSIKHILGHILKSNAPTLMTPGSVNTPMGITRVIREQLDETHKYFIVEMGAYGPGSIANLCQLAPPDMGIISAIGHSHYERFGSLDAVSRAKFEMADAVLEKSKNEEDEENKGKIIIHERTLRFTYPRQLLNKHVKRFSVCGDPSVSEVDRSYLNENDLHINSVDQRNNGLQVNLSWRGKVYTLQAPIFGIHHGHNIALAFAAAMELGLDPEDIGVALKSLPQISHRLEVKPQPDGVTIIDDAFNSNPVGFRSALDLLGTLKKDGRRNIIVTPGMVEMGAAHNDAHRTLGLQAGKICDIAVVVAGKRIPTFIEGFKSTGGDKDLIEVDSFREAAVWIDNNKKKGDLILLENDLPDMYERIPKM